MSFSDSVLTSHTIDTLVPICSDQFEVYLSHPTVREHMVESNLSANAELQETQI